MKSKTLKILKQESKMAISYELSHVIKFVSLSLVGIITTILFCVLWLENTKLGYGSLSKEYVISYFFLVLLVTRLTADTSVKFVMDSISKGMFSKYLIKPFSYLIEAFGINLGEQFLLTLFILPVIVVSGYFLKDYLVYDITPYTVFLFVISILIANILKFLVSQTYSLCAFWVKQNQGLKILYENIIIIFSGEIVPYAALPSYIIPFLQLLPFRYMLSFPIEILMGGMRPYDIQFGFIVSCIWVLFFFLVYKVFYMINVGKYEAEGI